MTENIRAIAVPANSAGTPSATPHARGSVLSATTAHWMATITAPVPSDLVRLPAHSGYLFGLLGDFVGAAGAAAKRHDGAQPGEHDQDDQRRGVGGGCHRESPPAGSRSVARVDNSAATRRSSAATTSGAAAVTVSVTRSSG